MPASGFSSDSSCSNEIGTNLTVSPALRSEGGLRCGSKRLSGARPMMRQPPGVGAG